MLAGSTEFGFAGHIVDLFAHPPEGRIDAGPLRLDVFRHCMLDDDLRLVEDGNALGHAGHELQSYQPLHSSVAQSRPGTVDQSGAGDHFRQDHGNGLQRFDFDVVVAARFGMLDAQDADR
jgi:hypothetical protein